MGCPGAESQNRTSELNLKSELKTFSLPGSIDEGAAAAVRRHGGGGWGAKQSARSEQKRQALFKRNMTNNLLVTKFSDECSVLYRVFERNRD